MLTFRKYVKHNLHTARTDDWSRKWEGWQSDCFLLCGFATCDVVLKEVYSRAPCSVHNTAPAPFSWRRHSAPFWRHLVCTVLLETFSESFRKERISHRLVSYLIKVHDMFGVLTCTWYGSQISYKVYFFLFVVNFYPNHYLRWLPLPRCFWRSLAKQAPAWLEIP